MGNANRDNIDNIYNNNTKTRINYQGSNNDCNILFTI